jgi:hypothetical protein
LNYYNIAKYYIEKGCLPIKSSLVYAIDTNNLEMLELLSNIKFTGIELNYVASKGNYKVFMYLISQGVDINNMTYDQVIKGYLNLLSDFSTFDESQTENFIKLF